MTQMGERNPLLHLQSNTNKLTSYRVYIESISDTGIGQYNQDPNGVALTVDQFGYKRNIGVSTYTGSGAIPQVGEEWQVDQSRGTWTFASRITQVKPTATTLASVIEALETLGYIDYTGNFTNFDIPSVTNDVIVSVDWGSVPQPPYNRYWGTEILNTSSSGIFTLPYPITFTTGYILLYALSGNGPTSLALTFSSFADNQVQGTAYSGASTFNSGSFHINYCLVGV